MRFLFRGAAALCMAMASAAFAQSSAAPAVPPTPAVIDPNAIRVLLVPELETTLAAQMNGTLGAFKFSLGQNVPKGELMAPLECREQQARANIAEAELAQARENLDAKRSLRDLNAVGDLEVSMANTAMQKALGERRLAVTQAGYCQVRAPFDARVAKVYAKPYQTVQAGAPLFDLVSDSALKVRLNVPSAMIRQVQPGQAFQVTIMETGKTYPAKVSAISARVDAIAQTVELEARLDKAYPDLIAGMSGVARFPAAQ
ncbi:efflux RND transporter periplasmic adaptor subunit [Variovorax dokdonensis]|uniref:Efflux RND transporter periplasmic adaptor subunit n=1 Tax=Variovorax dokdonensis TaxID=344883 RepID=A0ABT7N8U4_9BURK|nr:efflux RND transporter periplasmic adaptor subunit [Variovorax dokdonensis]MDM0044349.1 efflux RND transporter periplasmic adaptor subunit [Variovorax dokdonensis]